MNARRNFFASGELDRVSHLRTDSAWFSSQLGEARNRVTLVWRSKSLVHQGEETRAALLSPFDSGPLLERTDLIVLLGVHRGTVHFAADVSELESPHQHGNLGATRFEDLRRVGGVLDHHEGSILAYARAIMSWHRRHLFCGACGSPTRIEQAGHLRVCEKEDCGLQHFPRTDPAVIMLVVDGDRCLLGRQASWPPGVYSTLAGFVEPGESLEDAVAREVEEETGIVVDRVHYHSSQPWPFPSSIMLGFRATAGAGSIDLGSEELEDARWFSRQALARREVRLPPRLSIARRLIDDWVRSERDLP